MGGVAAGLTALIGGAGQGAFQAQQQIRGLLEQRREHLANLLTQGVLPELGGPERAEMITHIGNLLSGAPMGKTALGITKTLQSHQKDTADLHEAGSNLAALVGPQQGPTPNTAGPTPPGKPVGSGIPSGPNQNMTPAMGMSSLIAGGAAQPSASPVQPQSQQAPAQPQQQQQQQIQPIPQGSGLPSMSLDDLQSKLEGMSPAMRTAFQPFVANEAEYSRAQRMAQMELGWKQSALKEYMASPEWKQVPSMLQGQWRLWASTPGQNMPQMGYGMSAILNPFTQSTTAANLEAQHPGILAQYKIDPAVTPNVIVTRSRYGMSMGDDTPTMVAPEPPKFTTITNSDNTRSITPLVPGAAGVAPSEAAPSLRGIDTTTGRSAFTSPANSKAGYTPNSINLIPPGLVPKERTSTSTPTMEGGTVSSQVTRPVLSNSAPIKGVATASTPVPKTGGVWDSVKPFDPTTPLDHLVQMIGQDAANEKMISTTKPFSEDKNPNKAMVNKRMAQLGLAPNNVSGSIRDRAMTARTVLPHLDDVGRLIDQAEADGDIGIVMTRINQFFNNEIGVDPTKLVVGPDNTKHKILSELLTNLAFTSSAVGMVHGGVRAGSSLPMIEHWSSVLGAKDPNTLRSQLGVTRKWVDGYSQMAGETKPLPGITPLPGAASGGAGGGQTDTSGGYIKNHIYGGQEYLGGDFHSQENWRKAR